MKFWALVRYVESHNRLCFTGWVIKSLPNQDLMLLLYVIRRLQVQQFYWIHLRFRKWCPFTWRNVVVVEQWWGKLSQVSSTTSFLSTTTLYVAFCRFSPQINDGHAVINFLRFCRHFWGYNLSSSQQVKYKRIFRVRLQMTSYSSGRWREKFFFILHCFFTLKVYAFAFCIAFLKYLHYSQKST